MPRGRDQVWSRLFAFLATPAGPRNSSGWPILGYWGQQLNNFPRFILNRRQRRKRIQKRKQQTKRLAPTFAGRFASRVGVMIIGGD
jgi:hypothetical protein